MFDRVGVIAYRQASPMPTRCSKPPSRPAADDVSSGEEGHEVVCAQDSYGEVAKALEAPLRRSDPHGPDLEGAEHHRCR